MDGEGRLEVLRKLQSYKETQPPCACERCRHLVCRNMQYRDQLLYSSSIKNVKIRTNQETARHGNTVKPSIEHTVHLHTRSTSTHSQTKCTATLFKLKPYVLLVPLIRCIMGLISQEFHLFSFFLFLFCCFNKKPQILNRFSLSPSL